MLLPQRRSMASDDGELVDMSALGARSGQPFPLGTAYPRGRTPGTDEMRLGGETTAFHGWWRGIAPCSMARRSPPESIVDAFLAGFRRVYWSHRGSTETSLLTTRQASWTASQ